VTAEYNYSVPGVLKNAIDWGTQPHGDNAWDGKPAAIMGASNSIVGSARAQYHLRQVLVAVNVHALNRPEVLIGKAAEKFAQDGSLTDEPTAERIRQLLAALVQWTRVLQQGRADD